jgi:hypothetical protein
VSIKDTWQHQWNSSVFNKLKTIKPVLGETILKKISSRRDQVVLHPARIGHTFLAHAFLLHHEDAPECSTYQCVQIVQHILLDCPNFAQVRLKYFQVNSMFELFNKTQPRHIISYLKDINFSSRF